MLLREGFLRLNSKLLLHVFDDFNGKRLIDISVWVHFIYGSWYKKPELGTRAAVFVCFRHLGSMAGGWIQARLLESLAGKDGQPAWRWIFIIVSVITIPIAIFGKFESAWEALDAC